MADWMQKKSAPQTQKEPSSAPPNATSNSASSASTHPTTDHSKKSNALPGNLPSINLPKGGGAISGIGEKFNVNPVTGTASASIPIPASAGRAGFGPSLEVTYSSGEGNGPFGFGWQLSIPSITRKTSKGLPLYRDAEDSDVFVLAGTEDLMPALSRSSHGEWTPVKCEKSVGKDKFLVKSYRPRVEGLFSRVERWTNASSGDTHWRTISSSNTISIYGDDVNSRVFDPKEPRHVFSWLVSRTYDDIGNLMLFDYKTENSEGVDQMKASEFRRSSLSLTAARYLKRIRYGNRMSALQVEKKSAVHDFMFEVVFDYGDHDMQNPTPRESQSWPVRKDPFSTYRSCFEVRTYRLCHRALLFHHFPDDKNVGQDLLVASLDFSYDHSGGLVVGGNAIATCLSSATRKGYYRTAKGYVHQSLPPVEFKYSEAKFSHEVKTVDSVSLGDLPVGAGEQFQWLDLDGEGIPGILTKQGGAYFYKPNLGNGKLGPMTSLPFIPSIFYQQSRGQQWLDLAGDGKVDLVQFDGTSPGFYKRNPSAQGGWEPFQTFPSQPSVSMTDPNCKFLDLTGDGLADVLITDDFIFTWYPGLGQAGFGPAKYWRPPLDEDHGPHILFSDGVEVVYSADMSGDGLNDLVRIRNGEVCYWPNMGYGHFGFKISMDNSPWFDLPDQFKQSRLHLADIDGSGATDIIYIAADGVKAFLNLSGNGWSHIHHIRSFPRVDDDNDVDVLDFLGQGTACLVWSSELLGDQGRQMKYLNLMNEGKPYLLKSVINNLGSETYISYTTSTQLYLEDKARGQPWATRLPFPVHVVDRQEILDRISRNRFVTRFRYRHGYYDGFEREYRGFGFVETLDTEDFEVEHRSQLLLNATNLDPAFKSPPVLTKTWQSTGAYFEDERIMRHYKMEYYKEPGLDAEELTSLKLPETFIPTAIQIGSEEFAYTVTPEEAREAYRSLQGHAVHQEIYSLDGSYQQPQPYSVTEGTFKIKMFQPKPKGLNRYAVFYPYQQESVEFSYERALYSISGQKHKRADPRVSHTIVLATDEFGHVLSSLSIGYGRRFDDKSSLLSEDDRKKQKTPSSVLSLHNYTNKIDESDMYRIPMPYESLTYEIGNWPPTPPADAVVPLTKFANALEVTHSLSNGKSDVPFQDWTGASAKLNVPFRRLLDHDRLLFRRDDLSGPLPLGKVQSLALPFESYTQAFTPSLAHDVYVASGKVKSDEALENIFTDSCRFVRFGDNDNWWFPSGHVYYSPGTNDSPVEESAYAEAHFYLPMRHRDPFYSESFNTESSIAYDRYDLLVLDTCDAVGNHVTTGTRPLDPSKPIEPAIDYRVLAPKLVMDANRNRTAAGFDILGMATVTAVMGKPEEELGDSIAGMELFLPDEDVNNYLKDPLTHAHQLLGTATTRMVYDVWAYYRAKGSDHPPAVAATIQREQHVSQLNSGEKPELQQGFVYSDGFGRGIQVKALTELDPGTKKPRWITSGWSIYNNKGTPVRTYEPFFSDTNLYEAETKVGVSSIMLLDPLQRSVATVTPNHAWAKNIFDPWTHQAWDHNDTALLDPREDVDVGGYFRQLPETDYLPTWYDARIDGQMGPEEKEAAVKTAVHADTPGTVFLDALGRTIVSVARNKEKRSSDAQVESENFISRFSCDISGNTRIAFDSLGRTVQTTDIDMTNHTIHQASMESGEKWTVSSCLGNPVHDWNSRGFELSSTYDVLQRVTETHLKQDDGSKFMISKVIYGENFADAEAHNWRNKVVKSFDQANVSVIEEYDFKGNALQTLMHYVENYKITVNWLVDVPLTEERFQSFITYDALNRPLTSTLPDGSVLKQEYTKTGLAKRVSAKLQGADDWTTYMTGARYNALNQQTLMKFGNGVHTEYSYDPFTYLVDKIATHRPSPDSNSSREKSELQNLKYTYDAMANIVQVQDSAQQTIFFRNQVVKPSSCFIYDALYRLIEATGREHLGQSNRPTPYGPSNRTQTGHLTPGDGKAMARYTESYVYDQVGNILLLQHSGSDATQTSWTRKYVYNEPSQLDPAVNNNRLSSTRTGRETQEYRYDGKEGLTGNMTSMLHLPLMCWDFKDQFRASSQQRVPAGDIPETTWYSYTSGKRVRKTTDRHVTAGGILTMKCDHLYQGPFEVYREYAGNGQTVKLERTTVHIKANGERIALIEMTKKSQKSSGDSSDGPITSTLTRYQHGNNLSSALLELDGQARIISYEEYFPFGSTSYQAKRSQTEARKRYRYTGKERDDETGMYYHEARYCAPWLGRWISADPAGLVDGPNLYQYVLSNPISHSDPSGTAAKKNGSGGGAKTKKPAARQRSNVPDGKLWGRADYGHKGIPDNLYGQGKKGGFTVERDHPNQVSLREKQTKGAYNRAVSKSNHESTVYLTKEAHNALKPLQNDINRRVLSGQIKGEAELIIETRKAYAQIEKQFNIKIDPKAVDASLRDQLNTLFGIGKTKKEKGRFNRTKGPTTATETQLDASLDAMASTPVESKGGGGSEGGEAPKGGATGGAPEGGATSGEASAAPSRKGQEGFATVEGMASVPGAAADVYFAGGTILHASADVKHGHYGRALVRVAAFKLLGKGIARLGGEWAIPVVLLVTAVSPSQLTPGEEAGFAEMQRKEDEFAAEHPEADGAGGVMLMKLVYRSVLEPWRDIKSGWKALQEP